MLLLSLILAQVLTRDSVGQQAVITPTTCSSGQFIASLSTAALGGCTVITGPDIASGTINPDRLGSGGAVGRYLRYDSTWQPLAGGGDLLSTNNLSDVANAGTSRSNLGLAAMAQVASVTLTGDVTGNGTSSFAATIANDAVTNAKAANMANATFKCRTTAGTGDPEDCTVAQSKALLQSPALVRLAADSALSTITKTNLTGMSFTLAASSLYNYECHFYTTANANTVGVQFAITYSGTVASALGMFQGPGAATTLLWISDSSFQMDFNPTASQGNVAGMVTLSRNIETTNGGTLQFMHGSETATLTTVQRGSWCRLYQH